MQIQTIRPRLRRRAVLIMAAIGLTMPILATSLGAQAEPRLVRNINTLDGGGSQPVFKGTLDGRALWVAVERGKQTLWASDGTLADSERLVEDLPHGRFRRSRYTVSNRAIFLWERNTPGLFRTEGIVDSLDTLFASSFVVSAAFHAELDILFVVTIRDAEHWDLWCADARGENARQIATLERVDSPSATSFFIDTTQPGRAWLLSRISIGSVWTSDGTEAGTGLVRDDTFGYQHVADTTLVFVRGLGLREEILRSGGTAASTVPFATVDGGDQRAQTWTGLRPTRSGRQVFFVLVSDQLILGDDPRYELRALDMATGEIEVLQRFEVDPVIGADFIEFVEAGGYVYASVDDGVHGRELWRTDGTAEGTALAGDLCSGTCSSTPRASDFRTAERDGRLAFTAHDADGCSVLWTVRGEVAPVRLPIDRGCDDKQFSSIINEAGDVVLVSGLSAIWSIDIANQAIASLGTPLSFGDFGTLLPVTGGVLFNGDDGTTGSEPWFTDGTPEGTRRLVDIDVFDDSSSPGGFARWRDQVVFLADDPQSGLWISDGQLEGTRRISGGTGIDAFTVVKDHFVLWQEVAEDGGIQLFAADDQALSNPRLLLTLDRSDDIDYRITAKLGHRFVFSLESRLWVTDGTTEGTTPLGDPTWNIANGVPPIVLGDTAILRVASGPYLYTNGTESGTAALDQAGPTAFQGEPFATVEGGFLSRLADEVWFTDATTFETRPLIEREDGIDSVRFLCSIDDRAIFFLDGRDEVRAYGTDGQSEGLMSGFDFVAPFADSSGSCFVETGSSINDSSLVFRVTGDPRDTTLVHRFEDRDFASDRTVWSDGRLYFTDDQARLFTLDAVADASTLLFDSSRSMSLHSLGNGDLAFSYSESNPGQVAAPGEFWRTDGTPEGTRFVTTERPQELIQLGAQTLARLFRPDTGSELFAFDDGAVAPPSLPLRDTDRFALRVEWRDPSGRLGTGVGTPVRLTDDTGHFTFFRETNVEVMAKVLDGRAVNGHFWVFFASLSNVEYTLSVVDRVTGAIKRYRNPAGQFASVGDTNAFRAALDGVAPDSIAASLTQGPPLISTRGILPKATGMPCNQTDDALCLQQQRFTIGVEWTKPDGTSGEGTAVSLTPDSGYFTFFNERNVELVIKVLDGRTVNGNFWVFFGALSNLEYRITVTDTETGDVRTYENPAERFASVGDTQAFAATPDS